MCLKKDEKYAHHLSKNFSSGVKAGSVTVLEGVTVSGAAAEVTSALPLTNDEQANVKRVSPACLASTSALTRNILGGFDRPRGRRIVDGSARGKGLRRFATICEVVSGNCVIEKRVRDCLTLFDL